MNWVEKMKADAERFGYVPPGVKVHVMETTAAARGDYQVGFVGAGFNRFLAVLSPLNGSPPILVNAPIWTDLETCLGAARKLAQTASD
ncbi:MAG: hypothetical protein AAFQ18_00070 [Pseudomonadota bacterium]